MHRKSVLFITGGLELTDILRRTLSQMDTVTRIATPSNYQSLVSQASFDLAIVDMGREAVRELPRLESCLFEDGPVSLLLLADTDYLSEIRLSVRIPSDFIVRSASDEEYGARIHQLLWPGEEASNADFIRIDNMTVNLATYQVNVAGEPIDLTYLEYALFAFLITHPGRTYSRDALLRRVWGFEYYGGSRTVDVHVRRIRAKLGPELAQRLETVRGVGYLWST